MLTKLSSRHDQLIRGIDSDFAVGRRTHLRYAFCSAFAGWGKINSNGPEPFEYLEYAKSDLMSGKPGSAINALGNAKRAIHLTLVSFLEIIGLEPAYGKARFPAQLSIIQKLNAFPTRMLKNLNQKRNVVEHEYKAIEIDESADFVDVAEMFLLLAYPYLQQTVVSAYVGIEGDDRCLAWVLDLPSKVCIYEIRDYRIVNSPIGNLYYPHSSDHNSWSPLQTISITKANEDEWLPYLDLFVYWSKRLMTRPSNEVVDKPGIFKWPWHAESLRE